MDSCERYVYLCDVRKFMILSDTDQNWAASHITSLHPCGTALSMQTSCSYGISLKDTPDSSYCTLSEHKEFTLTLHIHTNGTPNTQKTSFPAMALQVQIIIFLACCQSVVPLQISARSLMESRPEIIGNS